MFGWLRKWWWIIPPALAGAWFIFELGTITITSYVDEQRNYLLEKKFRSGKKIVCGNEKYNASEITKGKWYLNKDYKLTVNFISNSFPQRKYEYTECLKGSEDLTFWSIFSKTLSNTK